MRVVYSLSILEVFIMATMTIRRANHERKNLDAKINSLSRLIENGDNALLGYYQRFNPFIGTKTNEEFEKLVKENWQSLNDLIARREKLNRAVMIANATTMVEVPVFVALDQNLALEKDVKTEQISIAAAIARKQYYQSVLKSLMSSIKRHVTNIATRFASDTKKLNKEMMDQLNKQFGPESTQNAEARVKYQQSIKENYEVILLDPLKMEDRVKAIYDYIDKYVIEIDSLISHATETTEVEVED